MTYVVLRKGQDAKQNPGWVRATGGGGWGAVYVTSCSVENANHS